MLSLWTTLRIIFSLIFTLLCLYFTQFITAVGEKKCPLSKSLYISNGKLLSSLLMIIAVINIFIPINKFLAILVKILPSFLIKL